MGARMSSCATVFERTKFLTSAELADEPSGSDLEKESAPMTQIPYLVKFVHNNSGPYLATLAEFSIRLLQWQDTDRSSVLRVQRLVKDETYAQEWGARLRYNPRTLGEVIQAMSDGYWSLNSPRLVKIEVGDRISLLQTPPRIDLLRSVPIPIPFVLKNNRAGSARVSIMMVREGVREAHAQCALGPGEARGLYINLSATTELAKSVRCRVQVGPLNTEIDIPVQTWEPGVLKVRIHDEADRLTPARIYLTGADGRPYAPEGVAQRITNGDYGQPYGGEYFFYTEGEFEVTVPAGKSLLEVVKGLECTPIRQVVNIIPLAPTQVELRIQKPFDMAKKGWYSGDNHIHANLFEATHLDPRQVGPEALLKIARAEDLNVSNILICNDEFTGINDQDRFEGRPSPLSGDNYLLYWNEEVRNLSLYGHVAFLELRKLVEPFYTGQAGTPYAYDYPPNFTQAAEARRQGATVTYVHPSPTDEFPVDIALGVADTLDLMSQVDAEKTMVYWYKLLNCGFRCPASAGTDTYVNIPYHLIAGADRVYVHVGPKLTYHDWMNGYRQGRSFVTNGPMLSFTVNGKEPGEEIHSPRPIEVRVEAEAFSHIPMEKMEIIVNGRVVGSQEAEPEGKWARLSHSLTIVDSSWLALRIVGPSNRLVVNNKRLFAHSSPVFYYLAGKKIAFEEDALFWVTQIEDLIRRTEQSGTFRTPEDKQRVIALFRRGQAVYRKIAAGATRN
jgi:hypothetical protein